MAKDWNVDDYRMEHETTDHWELRKKFMLAHKHKFPEEKVVCLAQVFANVEFMGCRYPQETMELVAELSRGVVEDYRNSRKSKLKRTFVAASDAAGAKVKGLKVAQLSPDAGKLPEDVASAIRIDESRNYDSGNHAHSITYGPSISEIVQKRREVSSNLSMPANVSYPKKSAIASYSSPYKYYAKNIPKPNVKPARPTDISQFVILRTKDHNTRETSLEILRRSASNSGFKLELKTKGQNTGGITEVFLNGELVATAFAGTKKKAKEAGAAKALEQLQKSCYTVLKKNAITADKVVEKGDVLNTQQASTSSQSECLDDNNVGAKLLKLMGWTGGGLGANKQGITEPIMAQEHVKRAGLGLSPQESKPNHQFRTKIWKILKEYALDPCKTCNKSLVFSADFSKEERAEIHQIAQKFRLKSKSFFKQDRQLVVSHKFSLQEILAELQKSGGSNDKYELLPPAMEVIQID